MKDSDFKAVQKFEINNDYAEIWRSDKGNGGDCIVGFRGSDYPPDGDLFADLITSVTRTVEGVKNVGAGIAHEFDGGQHVTDGGVIGKMRKDGGFTTLQGCKTIMATGHSLGGALASLFAAAANKKGDPMKAGITVDYLYTFGATPIASNGGITNDKSKDGCFKGTRYVATKYSGSPWNRRYADGAVWVGAPGGGHNGKFRMREGQLRHAKVEMKAIEQIGGKTVNTVKCKDAPLEPTGKDDLWGSIELHSSDKYMEAFSR